jgi:MoaA/NifB/PqqE/SkfB family radical SAM enzyme
MEEDTFFRLVDQMKDRGVERTSLFLMNEPLIDRRLERFTAHLKREDPKTDALIFTNGVLLTPERALSLAEAGMDEINVSINGFDRDSHERVMQGISYDRVMNNLKALGRILKRGELGPLRVKVVGLSLPGRSEGAEAFREETGLEVYLKPVTNRAGLIDTGPLSGRVDERGQGSLCQRPFVKAYVLYNGDMVLCNCDWMRTTIIGNIASRTLEELWQGPEMTAIRRSHLEGTLPDRLPCGDCDYPYLI